MWHVSQKINFAGKILLRYPWDATNHLLAVLLNILDKRN